MARGNYLMAIQPAGFSEKRKREVIVPAVSKSQRRLAGMALAAKGGRGPAPMGGGMMGMTLDDLKHYAGTKEKGLPKRKGKKVAKKGK